MLDFTTLLYGSITLVLATLISVSNLYYMAPETWDEMNTLFILVLRAVGHAPRARHGEDDSLG